MTFEDWGDGYGHRAHTFNQTVAYLDGQRPSVVIGRGIYHPAGAGSGVEQGKTELVAYDWRDGSLTQRWTFTAIEGTPTDNIYPRFAGMGNHQLSVVDSDGDGFDEIVWGAMVVDHDGTGLVTTDQGHGDALHVSDMDPSNPGYEVFKPNENPGEYGDSGSILYDPQTGVKLAKLPPGGDVGRGVALDIDGYYPGFEMWASNSGDIFAIDGTVIYGKPGNMFQNFGVWWDADPLRELLDSTVISKWNYEDTNPSIAGIQNLGRSNFDMDISVGGHQSFAPDVSSNNSTKSTPALSADLWGDWREEVIWRKSDNSALRIFTTVISASMRLPTLMHDIQYREAIAWQNGYYNQPPHPSFFIGAGMTIPDMPNVYLAGVTPELPGDYNQDNVVNAADYTVWRDTLGQSGLAPYSGADGDGDGTVDADDHQVWVSNFGATLPAAAAVSAPSTSLTDSSPVSLSEASEVELVTVELFEEASLPTAVLSLQVDEPEQTSQSRKKAGRSSATKSCQQRLETMLCYYFTLNSSITIDLSLNLILTPKWIAIPMIKQYMIII